MPTTASVVGLVTTGILVLGTAGTIMASSSMASDATSFDGKSAGRSGPTPVEARPLALARGTGFDLAMFMVGFFGRDMRSVLPLKGDVRHMDV